MITETGREFQQLSEDIFSISVNAPTLSTTPGPNICKDEFFLVFYERSQKIPFQLTSTRAAILSHRTVQSVSQSVSSLSSRTAEQSDQQLDGCTQLVE